MGIGIAWLWGGAGHALYNCVPLGGRGSASGPATILAGREGATACHNFAVNRRVVDREALVGVIVAGGFGTGWALWAASGLTGGTASVVRIAGVAVGAVIVAGAVFRRRQARPGGRAGISESGSMFGSRGYLVWVAVELIAIVAGNAVLGATGHADYVAAWTALVVGVHFLGFGRLFAAMFYWLGGAFIAAAIVGAVVGAAEGTRQAVEASTGLVAGGSLFAAGAWGLCGYPDAEASGSRR